MCHISQAGAAVTLITSSITARGPGGSEQLGFHRLLAYQPRKHPCHHRQQ
jgi:hypothetical protein